MAYPVIQSSGSSTANATTLTVSLPSGSTSGDLIIIVLGCRQESTTFSLHSGTTGWTSLDEDGGLSIWYKKIGSSEANPVFDNSFGSQRLTAYAYRIDTCADPDITPPEALVAYSTGVLQQPNPPDLTPSASANKDYLWIAACTLSTGTVTISAAPSNYGNLHVTQNGTASAGNSVGTADRQNNASSENPGAFTISSDQAYNRAVTIVIYPAPATSSTTRSASLTAKSTSNSTRGVELTGSASSNSTRGVELTGSADSNNTRNVTLFGKDSSSSTRSSYITGQNSSNSTRNSSLIGKNVSNSTRDASLSGKAQSSTTRPSEVIGKDLSNSTRLSSIIGKSTSNSTRESNLTGISSSNSTRVSSLSGKNTSSSTRSSNIIGKLDSSSVRNASLAGIEGSSSTRSVELYGVATSSSVRNSKTTGGLNSSATRDAKLQGSSISNSTRSSKVTGTAGSGTSNSIRSAYLRGIPVPAFTAWELALPSLEKDAFLWGLKSGPKGSTLHWPEAALEVNNISFTSFNTEIVGFSHEWSKTTSNTTFNRWRGYLAFNTSGWRNFGWPESAKLRLYVVDSYASIASDVYTYHWDWNLMVETVSGLTNRNKAYSWGGDNDNPEYGFGEEPTWQGAWGYVPYTNPHHNLNETVFKGKYSDIITNNSVDGIQSLDISGHCYRFRNGWIEIPISLDYINEIGESHFKLGSFNELIGTTPRAVINETHSAWMQFNTYEIANSLSPEFVITYIQPNYYMRELRNADLSIQRYLQNLINLDVTLSGTQIIDGYPGDSEFFTKSRNVSIEHLSSISTDIEVGTNKNINNRRFAIDIACDKNGELADLTDKIHSNLFGSIELLDFSYGFINPYPIGKVYFTFSQIQRILVPDAIDKQYYRNIILLDIDTITN